MGWRIYISMGVEKDKKKMIEEKPNKKIQKLLIEAANHHKNNHLEDLEKVLRKIILLVQARKPIFKSSINSWLNYKDFLKPLTDKLNI